MNLPLEGPLDRVRRHMVDLRPEWSIRRAVLGTLPCIMSGLSPIETRIVALAFFAHLAGHDILDLSSGLVNILLPVGFVLHLSLLPSTCLLHWLTLLLRLKLMFVIIISRLIVMHKLVLPFSNEGLVYQSLEIRQIKHTEGASEVLV